LASYSAGTGKTREKGLNLGGATFFRGKSPISKTPQLKGGGSGGVGSAHRQKIGAIWAIPGQPWPTGESFPKLQADRPPISYGKQPKKPDFSGGISIFTMQWKKFVLTRVFDAILPFTPGGGVFSPPHKQKTKNGFWEGFRGNFAYIRGSGVPFACSVPLLYTGYFRNFGVRGGGLARAASGWGTPGRATSAPGVRRGPPPGA